MKSRIAKFVCSAIAAFGFALPAIASTSGENAGTIAGNGSIFTYTLNGQQVFEFQINGSDGRVLNTLCPGHNFVYLNWNDNNANTIYNTLVIADKHHSNVYVFWTTDATGNCHITRLYY
jgi:hypothetical protein